MVNGSEASLPPSWDGADSLLEPLRKEPGYIALERAPRFPM
jgi:hypothetical protein